MRDMTKELAYLAAVLYRKPPENLTATELHDVLARAVLSRVDGAWERTRQKNAARRRAYYFSAEFLVGRAIYNNLLCTGLTADAAAALENVGQSLARFEEIEDAALGNGGLGRLAACFLDSAATLRLPLDGYGIRYRFGLFRQRFEDGFQQEVADDWAKAGDPWSIRREEDAVTVPFPDGDVLAVPYDMPIIGYGGRHVSTLRLWQSEPLVPFDFTSFNDQRYDDAVRDKNRAEDISRVLYPNDSTPAGKRLRLKQQYFFCAASLADILRRYEATHGDAWDALPDFVTIQLNDTHPVIAIPELIRLLGERGVAFGTAVELARRVFCYTNHTVMQEALEKWDISTLRRVCPAVTAIIRQLAARQKADLRRRGVPPEEWGQMLLLQGTTVHMAYLACWCSTYVNGVAALHTDILRNRVLRAWETHYPGKIQNKTNGITQRRWLLLCNPSLSALLTEKLGDDRWITDLDRLRRLEPLAADKATLHRFLEIKQENKRRLAAVIDARDGLTFDPDTLLDVQIKRLHEYKRQLLNALCILALCFEIEDGTLTDFVPTTFLFGAKAAPGYYRAKAIIKFVHAVGERVDRSDAAHERLRVLFVNNYDVSYAESIVAAADVSEQISTAGTEASGTGNMKLMLNGAVTLGTYDGANVEIVQEVGEENAYIFGLRVADVERVRGHYRPRALYEHEPLLRRCLDALIDGTLDDGGTGMFRDLYTALLDGTDGQKPDPYFVLADFAACLDTKKRLNRDFAQDRLAFAAKQWKNVCAAGKFSSDRTVSEYAKDIWKIK